MTVPEVLAPLRLRDPGEIDWDDTADVVIVGLGGAGACAAIEAAGAGADTVVLDRFTGGGDTCLSGGAVYAGGGTPAQLAAGYPDTAANMFEYLKLEVDGAVGDGTLRRFCDGSLADLAWLRRHGVQFGTECWPDKTPFPPDGYYLFYSGSEQTGPFDQAAEPAPRAHKTLADGMGAGSVFYAALAAAAGRSGARVRLQTRVRRLVTDAGGRVVGVECAVFGGGPLGRLAGLQHRLFAALVKRTPAIVAVGPVLPALFRALSACERLGQRRTLRVRARTAVVLATGGYGHNPEMIERLAPYARRLMTIGFDANGSGILLGQGVGAGTRYLADVGMFRMFVPPLAFGRGMLVDAEGRRFANEFWYSGRIGAAQRTRGGAGYLVLDRSLVRQARAEFPRLRFFSTAPARIWLATATRADTLAGLAGKLRMDPVALAATRDQVAGVAGGAADPFHRTPEQTAPLDTPPYYAIDLSLAARPLPATTFSLGGLAVDEDTGAVLTEAGTTIPGLYAAGRAAVGICSNSYVSGLALADCVFSGRRAGLHAAAGKA